MLAPQATVRRYWIRFTYNMRRCQKYSVEWGKVRFEVTFKPISGFYHLCKLVKANSRYFINYIHNCKLTYERRTREISIPCARRNTCGVGGAKERMGEGGEHNERKENRGELTLTSKSEYIYSVSLKYLPCSPKMSTVTFNAQNWCRSYFCFKNREGRQLVPGRGANQWKVRDLKQAACLRFLTLSITVYHSCSENFSEAPCGSA